MTPRATAGNESVYCIYSDSEVGGGEANLDHVIPLALGGTDEFRVVARSDLNGKMSGEIEGPLANDFLVHVARSRGQVLGHSARVPRARAKKAKIVEPDSERPVSLEFGDKDGLRVWDPKKKLYLTEQEMSGLTITNSVSIDLSIRIRFTAKVALGAGYYTYGERFRRTVDHAELRALMWSYSHARKETLRNLKTRVYDQFSEIAPADREVVVILKALCESAAGSCVILGVGPSNLLIAVGVLRTFIGLVNVPADSAELRRTNEGVALVVKNGNLKTISLDSAMAQLGKGIEEARRRASAKANDAQ